MREGYPVKKNNIFFGVIVIVIGLLLLLDSLKVFDNSFNFLDIGFLAGRFWATLFLILPGLLFHYSYFAKGRKDAGLLVPGGILFVVGLTCQLSVLFDVWSVLWPGFILAVAVGLYELYLFGNRDKGLLIPVGILGGLSAIFFVYISFEPYLDNRYRQLILPVIVIAIGIAVLFKNRSSRKST
jgi:hypothetical protein